MKIIKEGRMYGSYEITKIGGAKKRDIERVTSAACSLGIRKKIPGEDNHSFYVVQGLRMIDWH